MCKQSCSLSVHSALVMSTVRALDLAGVLSICFRVQVWFSESHRRCERHLAALFVRVSLVCSVSHLVVLKKLSFRLFGPRVWSGDDGTHLRTLEGHADVVCSLAVGLDGKVYSGSFDKTIRVWSGEDGTHLHTLMGHTSIVSALCVGRSNTVYSASYDTTIRVWSGEDGTHLRTLLWPGNCVEVFFMFRLNRRLAFGDAVMANTCTHCEEVSLSKRL
jgi:WD40 repeat protein